MQAIVLPKDVFEEMRSDLKFVKQRVHDLTAPDERIVENQEFLKIMKISYKTAHTWRTEGKISYSKEGNKIYYRMSDIREFLDRYHYKAFAQANNLI